MTLGSLPVARCLEVARTEGPGALRSHLLDRWEELRRRRRFERLGTVRWSEEISPAVMPGLPSVGVLSFLPTAPSPWLGGVQRSVLARLGARSADVGSAFLFPEERGYRLEARRGREALAIDLLPGGEEDIESFRDPELERACAWALKTVGARTLHVENLHRAPFGSLLALQDLGFRLVISLHDFSPFCRRPHLLERPMLVFCEYCRDLERCGRCLREDWHVDDEFQSRYRGAAHRLLRSADALIYPSAFLRDRIVRLFENLGRESSRHWIIPPAVAGLGPPEAFRSGRRFRVALVGQVKPHKGALIFRDLVRRWRDPDGLRVRWMVLGGGDPELLRSLASEPAVEVRGYYRAGELPELLRRLRVDLALLLSVVPESYGLTLDECRAAGVPVVAFDLGAVGQRIREEGGGEVVPLEEGLSGLTELLHSLVLGAPIPELHGSLPRLEDVFRRHEELYRQIGQPGNRSPSQGS